MKSDKTVMEIDKLMQRLKEETGEFIVFVEFEEEAEDNDE